MCAYVPTSWAFMQAAVMIWYWSLDKTAALSAI